MSTLSSKLFGGAAPATTGDDPKKAGATNKAASGNKNDASSAAPAPVAFEPVKKTKLNLFQRAPEAKRETRKMKKSREEEEAKKKATAAKDAGGKPAKKIRTKKHISHSKDKDEDELARTVFVGNLPNDVDKKAVQKIFTDCGTVVATRVRSQVLSDEQAKADGKNRGRAVRVLRGEIRKDAHISATAYVIFEKKNSIDAAVRKNGIVFQNRHIVVTREDAHSKAFDPKLSVFVGALPYDVSDEQVRSFFVDGGVTDVTRVRVIRDRETGLSRGIAYVEFAKHRSVEHAIKLRGGKISDREVRICHVQPSKDPELKRGQLSRREKRHRENVSATESGPEQQHKKKRRTEGGAAGENDKSKDAEDVPAWMGMATNPRKKLARDLRPLIDSGVRNAAPRKPGGGGGGANKKKPSGPSSGGAKK